MLGGAEALPPEVVRGIGEPGHAPHQVALPSLLAHARDANRQRGAPPSRACHVARRLGPGHSKGRPSASSICKSAAASASLARSSDALSSLHFPLARASLELVD